jgi:DNA polymerase I-like protein with 3'-5' exonuclease and polymerase domains
LRVVFDIETNGFLKVLDRVHCISTANEDDEETRLYEPNGVVDGLMELSKAEALIAHNGINFDIPAIQKVYPWFEFSGEVIDTLVYSRLLWPDLRDRDAGRVAAFKRSNGKSGMPPRLMGSHSLEAWGYRLKVYKGEFGKTTDWQHYDSEMGEYCRQDVVVTVKLWERIKVELTRREVSKLSIWLEHQASWLLAQQERNGFKFDEAAAIQLYGELVQQREDIKSQLIDKYGSWYVANEVKVPKKTIRYKDKLRGDLTEGAPYTKIKLVQFNPASRDHIAKVLMERGWKPKEFTNGGKPKIDETVLEGIGTEDAKLFAKFFMLNKRIGQLAEGDQAWLKMVTGEGFIHGSVNPNGAVTGRATHSHPNLAQVPATGAPYGEECRSLFTVPTGWFLLGSDASGLELRCLGHFMAKYDGGAYIKEILEGDIHWANAQAAGFIPVGTVRDKENEEHEDARKKAKRFIYAFLYGAGDELIGELIGYTDEDYHRWKAAGSHKPVIEQMKRKQERVVRKRVCHILKGKEVKKKFLKGLPALKKLISEVKDHAEEHGYILGLDGRHVPIRSSHAALNFLLQGAGALICKYWIIKVNQMMQEKGYKHGWNGDYAYCAWVHDEVQVAVRSREVGEELGKVCLEAMKFVEHEFNFRCPLDAEYDIGTTWKETH